jgi:hypothetical protein
MMTWTVERLSEPPVTPPAYFTGSQRTGHQHEPHPRTGRFSGLSRRRRAIGPVLSGLVRGTHAPSPFRVPEPVSTGFSQRLGKPVETGSVSALRYRRSAHPRPTSPERAGLSARLRRERPVNGAKASRGKNVNDLLPRSPVLGSGGSENRSRYSCASPKRARPALFDIRRYGHGPGLGEPHNRGSFACRGDLSNNFLRRPLYLPLKTIARLCLL